MMSDMQYRTRREEWAQAATDAGISLEAVAHFIGPSYSAVYRYASGTRTPTQDWLDRVDRMIEHPEAIDAANEAFAETLREAA